MALAAFSGGERERLSASMLEAPEQGDLHGGPVVEGASGLLLEIVSGKGDACDAEEIEIPRDSPAHAEVQFLSLIGADACLVGEEPEVIEGERELGCGCDVEADAMAVGVAVGHDFFGVDALHPGVEATGELGVESLIGLSVRIIAAETGLAVTKVGRPALPVRLSGWARACCAFSSSPAGSKRQGSDEASSW